MASRHNSSLTFLELAKSAARIQRQLKPDHWSRLLQAIAADSRPDQESSPLPGELTVDLAFGLDRASETSAETVVRVTGNAQLEVWLPCHLCEHTLPRVLSVELNHVIVNDETQAQQHQHLRPEDAIVVVAGAELDLQLLLEDELILAVPFRVCDDLNCSRRPQLSYGEGQSPQETRQRPFAQLDVLKAQLQDDEVTRNSDPLQSSDDRQT